MGKFRSLVEPESKYQRYPVELDIIGFCVHMEMFPEQQLMSRSNKDWETLLSQLDQDDPSLAEKFRRKRAGSSFWLKRKLAMPPCVRQIEHTKPEVSNHAELDKLTQVVKTKVSADRAADHTRHHKRRRKLHKPV